MHNDVVQSDIHSTDAFGYSEAIFATSYLLGFSYAPRFKNLKRQRLLQTYGHTRTTAYEPLPKWRSAARRPSCQDLVTLLRKQIEAQSFGQGTPTNVVGYPCIVQTAAPNISTIRAVMKRWKCPNCSDALMRVREAFRASKVQEGAIS
jgi:hypothetical protein